MNVMTDYFKPNVNVPFERHMLKQAGKTEDETIDQSVTRMRQLAITCDVVAEENNMIRDQVVESCCSQR